MVQKNKDSLVDGIYPQNFKYEFKKEKKVEEIQWKPWHKPRKQWLRYKQWIKEIENLLKQLRLNNRPLGYLSLPGDDLLDFRIVVDFCAKKNVKIKLVGFNDLTYSLKSSENSYAAKNDVFSNKIVAENSDIHEDDFKKISDLNSIAYNFVDKEAPYDIINLDLCLSFSGINQIESYYQATFNILNLQLNNSTQPWIFLLTTRADKSKVNIEDLPLFWKNIKSNIEQSDIFKKYLKENYLFNHYEIIYNSSNNFGNLKSPDFEKFFGLCISKWLLHIINPTTRWTMKVLDSYSYRTNSATNSFPNMLSLAFLFNPIPSDLSDPSSLAKQQKSNRKNKIIDEVSQANDILSKVNKITDLDKFLLDNDIELQFSIKKSEELLEKAGYEISSYKEWALNEVKKLFNSMGKPQSNPE